MTQFGVTPSGFVLKRLDNILGELQTALQTALGSGIDLSPDTPLGQIIGILAEREAKVWELAQAVNQNFDPDFAEGLNQDNLYAINNELRLPAVSSTLQLQISGTNGTVIPGTDTSPTPFKASVAGSNHTVVFQAVTTAVIAGGVAIVNAQCTVTGPTPAGAGTVTVIETPTTGVTSVTNLADAVPGRNLESSTAFRIRRLQDLQRSLAATNEGIRNTIVQVVGVIIAGLLENDGDVTDGNGLPPHSIEGLAEGGADQDVANAIFASKAAGIQTFGSITKTVVDSQGFSHNISFARPTLITIYLIVNVTRDTDPADGQPFPINGVQAIKDALTAFGALAAIGQDVINPRLVQVVMDAISGIAGLQILQGTAPVPVSSANIAVGPTQVMNIQAANITVNVT